MHSVKNVKPFEITFKAVLFYAALYISIEVNAQWVDISSNRNDIVFAGNIGFIVGDNGTILKSIDFGKNWVSVPNPFSKFYHAEYVRVSENGKNIKVLANRYLGQNALAAQSCAMIESNDEGLTWRVTFQKYGRGNGFFLNDQVGWIISNNIDQNDWNVFKTTNGGSNWIEDKTFPRVYAMNFYDHSNGWAIVNFSITGEDYAIVKTEDGGTTWKKSFQIKSRPNPFNFLIVTDANNAVYWGYGQSSEITKTTDGGATWSRVNFDYYGTISIQMLDSNRGWISDEHNGLYRTVDGFATIEKAQVVDGKKVWMKDEDNGFLIGSNGLLATTQDGAKTWDIKSHWQGKLINPNYHFETYPTTTDIFLRDNDYWIIGYGMASHADFNAQVWSDKVGQKKEAGKIDILNPYSPEVSGVSFFEEKGCMVGNGVGIRITNDNGKTWEDDNGKMPHIDNGKMPHIDNGNSPFYGDLYVDRKVYYQDENTIWIVGNAEYILKSVDSGKTFQVVLDCSTKNAVCGTSVRLAFLKDAIVAYYIDSSYKALVSYDSGISWNKTQEEIVLMSFLNENVGWKMLWNNDLYKTSDGGATWRLIRKMDFSFYLNTSQIKMSFVDEKAGWLVSDNQFFFTNDEGKTWKLEEKGVSLDIEQVKFYPLSSGEIVGLASGEGVLKYVGSYRPYIKETQTITFNSVPSKKYGDPNFLLSANSTSGMPISYTSSNPAVAIVSGNIVSIKGVGTSTLTAKQAGNIDFKSAEAEQVLTVDKANQTIYFNTITDKSIGSQPFNLIASSSSGLPVRFVSNSDKVALSDNLVTLIKQGRLSITASQDGNNEYNPAQANVQSFCVNPIKPIITVKETTVASAILISSSESGNQWFLNESKIPDATSSSLIASFNGTYKLQVKVDDCFSEFSNDQVMLITGDISSTKGTLEVEIFPNPVFSRLTANLDSDKIKKSVSIYNVEGQLVDSQESYESDIQFNTDKYVPGVYLLKVVASYNVKVIRFLKQ